MCAYTQHSGNWYAAHERLLTEVEQIFQAAGFRTRKRYVNTSRGCRRGDLLIFGANVADKPHLIVDVSISLLLNAALFSREHMLVHFTGIWTRYGIMAVNCRLLYPHLGFLFGMRARSSLSSSLFPSLLSSMLGQTGFRD